MQRLNIKKLQTVPKNLTGDCKEWSRPKIKADSKLILLTLRLYLIKNFTRKLSRKVSTRGANIINPNATSREASYDVILKLKSIANADKITNIKLTISKEPVAAINPLIMPLRTKFKSKIFDKYLSTTLIFKP